MTLGAMSTPELVDASNPGKGAENNPKTSVLGLRLYDGAQLIRTYAMNLYVLKFTDFLLNH
jgi:hypothetical protein